MQAMDMDGARSARFVPSKIFLRTLFGIYDTSASDVVFSSAI